jgi:FkbM family methyltransferase
MRAREVAHAALRRFGVDLVRYYGVNLTARRRIEELMARRLGLVLDVGANAGFFGDAVRSQGYAGRIVSFEPLAEAFAELEQRAQADPLWEARRVALADRDGEADLQVAGNSWSSSLLPMEARHVASAPASAVVRSERVPLVRLDTIWDEVRRDDRAYLKLDVQGAELDVLRGAGHALRDVEVVEAELSVVELYAGQPLLHDVVAFLEPHGFALVQLEPEFTDPQTAAILQLNGIFVRP